MTTSQGKSFDDADDSDPLGARRPFRLRDASAPDPLAVVARGLAIFPLPRGGRKPVIKDWPNRCITDPGVVAAHWRDGDNIGVGCKASGLVGVDLDRNHVLKDGTSADGVETFKRLCATHGQPWPNTLTVRTPRGGIHLYYRAPEGRTFGNSAGDKGLGLGVGIDTRGNGKTDTGGGYLIGPGSVVNGKRYTVVRDMEIQVLPEWLATLLDPPPAPRAPLRLAPRPQQTNRYVERALESEVQKVLDSDATGGRNDQLNRSAFALGTLVGANVLDRFDAETALRAAAEAVGLIGWTGERQVDATIRSGLNAGERKPRNIKQGDR